MSLIKARFELSQNNLFLDCVRVVDRGLPIALWKRQKTNLEAQPDHAFYLFLPQYEAAHWQSLLRDCMASRV